MGVWLWQFIGRIALPGLLPTLLTLSGCWDWAVAGPLLGVGTVGTGVAVAEVEHHKKIQPPATQAPAARQPENGSEAAANSDNPQVAAKNTDTPVVGTIQESTLPATLRAVRVASGEKLLGTSAEHHDKGVTVRSHRSALVTHKAHCKTVPLSSSMPPSTLPRTVIVD
jgi:hypothetical protein